MADSNQTHSRLEALVRAGLIQSEMAGTESEYVFKHVLTQETAYRGLLRRERMRLHRIIGELLEGLGGTVEDQYAVLAHHFYHAEDPRAFKYLRLAADSAFAKHALPEAYRLYSDALDVALRRRVPTEDLIHVFTRRGRVQELAADLDGALANYDELERMGSDTGDPRLTLSATIAKAKVHSMASTSHDPALAMQLAEKGLKLARELGDLRSQARLRWIQALAYIFSGKAELAVTNGERALELARSQGSPDLEAYILHDLGNARWFLGQVRKGLETHEQATPLWRKLDNLPMLADNLSQRALFNYTLGNLAHTLKLAAEAIEVADRIGNRWSQAQSRISLALALCEQGKIEAGMSTFDQAKRHSDQSGLLIGFIIIATEWGWRLAVLGETARGLALVDEADKGSETEMPVLRQWPLAVRARIFIRQDKTRQAESLIRKHLSGDFNDVIPKLSLFGAFHVGMARAELEVARGNLERALSELEPLLQALVASEMRTYLIPAVLLLAKIRRQLGDDEAAMEAASESLEIAGDIGAAMASVEAAALLAEFAHSRGDPTLAQKYHRQAARQVEALTARVGSESWRKAVLSWEVVKGLNLD